MFRMPKALDVITLFHAPHAPASIRMHNLLKRVSARASGFEEDPQWSEFSYKAGPIPRREPFDLNVQPSDPTPSQLGTIIDYARATGFSTSDVVQGATDKKHAVKLFTQDPGLFRRPTVVDWNAGWAVSGDFPERILRKWRGEGEEASTEEDKP
jgi:hypothetical protein